APGCPVVKVLIGLLKAPWGSQAPPPRVHPPQGSSLRRARNPFRGVLAPAGNKQPADRKRAESAAREELKFKSE
ncbi:hypothetical protein chiPu_0030088, partial [Chiloscyllium punctatum]|nr:hypothetical protein [Chiloscyllium punctatum]